MRAAACVSEIQWWPSDRAGELMAFVDQHWKHGHVLARDLDLLCWQHRIPGDPKHLSVLTASRGGRITGVLGVIRADARIRSERVRGAWLALWYVDASAGEGPLGLRLLNAAFAEGFQFIACSGMNDTAIRLFRAMRFHVVDAVPRWVYPAPGEALRSLTGVTAAPAAEAVPTLPKGLRIAEWTRDAASRWDAAWPAVAADAGDIGVWRDASHIDWRYALHPSYSYRIRVAEEGSGGPVHGLSVCRLEAIKDRPESVLRIVELTGTFDAMRVLSADLVATAQHHNVAFADFYSTRLACGAALEEVGFRRDGDASPYPSLFQPLDPRPRPLNIAVWTAEGLPVDDDVYFTRSDGDQDRPS